MEFVLGPGVIAICSPRVPPDHPGVGTGGKCANVCGSLDSYTMWTLTTLSFVTQRKELR